jgi:hypothetical protein
MEIKEIEIVQGGNRQFEVIFTAKDGDRYKLSFDDVWDLRYGIENAYIVRFIDFIRDAKEESSILLVENSKYIKYFEIQADGTLPVDQLKNYILFDKLDTVIEILTEEQPKLEKL